MVEERGLVGGGWEAVCEEGCHSGDREGKRGVEWPEGGDEVGL